MAGPGRAFPLATSWVREHPKLFEVQQSAYKYLTNTPPSPNNERYAQALSQATRDFAIRKILPLHINDAIKQFQNTDRSPGLPYTTRGFKRKDEVDPLIIKQYVHNLKYGIYNRCNTPCTAAVKTMVAKRKKFRLIWVYPAHMTFAEGMFAMPFIRAYQAKRGKYGLWINYAQGDMRLLMAQRRRQNRWIGADWSSFDSSIPAWLIRDAFDILRSYIDFTQYESWGRPTSPSSLPRLWDRIVHYFINTPLKFVNGKVIRKRRGIPSGSFFTNLIDSLTSCIVWHYLLGEKQTGNSWFVGDDALIEVRTRIDLKGVAREAFTTFGMNLNADKTGYGTHVSFLGYTMGVDGRPQASYEKLVAQLLLPQRPDREFSDFVARARALQLSCFGLGCWRFTSQVQLFLDTYAQGVEFRLHPRDDLYTKLKALDLCGWPPLSIVMQRV